MVWPSCERGPAGFGSITSRHIVHHNTITPRMYFLFSNEGSAQIPFLKPTNSLLYARCGLVITQRGELYWHAYLLYNHHI